MAPLLENRPTMMDFTMLAPVYPEIALAVGAMAVLMLGVFSRESERNSVLMAWLAVAVLVFAGVLLVLQPAGAQPVFDNAFVADGFGRFMKLLTLGGAAVTLILSLDYFRVLKPLRFELPILVLLATLGMMMMISANDLIALYLGLELQSLALYVVAAIRRDDLRSSEAGVKYFVLGALSSGMLLYGASLLYGFTGSTSFAVIAAATGAEGAGGNLGLIFGLVFLLVGLAFKVSAVPFHMWTPDVYEGAPTPVTAFFAAASKMASMALLVRVVMAPFSGIPAEWQQIVAFLAIASMGLGSFAAIGQTNIKRLMAYSSIGHVGFALTGLAANSAEGVAGVLIYLAIYLVMTLGAFACILSMRRKDGLVEDIGQLAGLARTNLPMAFALAVLLFSMAGIPPLAGFFAKFYVFAAAIKAGLVTLAIVAVVLSVVAAYYYLAIIKLMFFDEPKENFLPVERTAGLIMGAAALAMIVFVAVPGPIVDAAARAARSLAP